MIFKYKGWLGLAPIYVNDPDGACMVASRSKYLEWWLTINSLMFQLVGAIASWIVPDFEPNFPLRITGEANKDVKQ